MIVGVDIDGTLCNETDGWDYENRTPRLDIIKKVNALHKKGWVVVLYTARREYDRFKTVVWLKKYKVKYDDIIFDKPKFDLYVGDEVKRPEEL